MRLQRPDLPSAEFLRFCVAGSGGFLVDWGCLELLTRGCGLGPYQGRVLSLLLAATATWRLNRNFTFRHVPCANVRRQWSGYVLIVGAGAVLNFAVYAALLHRGTFAHHLLVPVEAGSRSRVAFNFLFTRRYVFGRD